MRVNIYAEEITDRVEIITKRTEDGEFTGVRFFLELPISVPSSGGHHVTHRGPFIHRPGDDDSSAVTFWGKRDLRKVLEKALNLLDKHHGLSPGQFGGVTDTGMTFGANKESISPWIAGPSSLKVCRWCGIREGEEHLGSCPVFVGGGRT